jgi:MoaA/NifB/PqqE/SkfB family radical SAM enzyme
LIGYFMILEVSTSVGCPIRCPYCPQTDIAKKYKGPKRLTLDVFRACLNHCPHGDTIIFAGVAEPYLNTDTSQMMREVVQSARKVSLYTTGVGMTPWDVSVLIHLAPELVVWHIPDAEGQMKVKITPEYVRLMEKMTAGLPRLNYLCFGTPHPQLAYLVKSLGNYPMHTRAGNVAHLPQRRAIVGPVRCHPGPNLDHPLMLPNGDLFVCVQDFGLQHPIGNLKEESWNVIYQGPKIAHLRGLMQSGDILCRTCEYAQPANPAG